MKTISEWSFPQHLFVQCPNCGATQELEDRDLFQRDGDPYARCDCDHVIDVIAQTFSPTLWPKAYLAALPTEVK